MLPVNSTWAQKKMPSGIRVCTDMPHLWGSAVTAVVTLTDSNKKMVKRQVVQIVADKQTIIDINTVPVGRYTLIIRADSGKKEDYEIVELIEKKADDTRILLTLETFKPHLRAGVKKPVIYLYPEHATSVSIKVNFKGQLTQTIPAYNGGWQVWADTNGRLTNQADGQHYPYLFWEGSTWKQDWNMQEGFVVRGRESREFLAQVLPQMGLAAKEYNEFIDYLAPAMERNEYNLVHFAGREYEDIAELSINPKPDAVLRVFMVFKATGKNTLATAQHFKGFSRKGFTVVEWGGMDLDKPEVSSVER